MDFDLSSEQRLLQESVGDFCAGEIPLERLIGLVDVGEARHRELWSGLCALGAAGVLVPEPYGGLGLGVLEAALLSESVGHHAMPGPYAQHVAATYAIALAGSEAQQRRWLPALATGECLATLAWHEDADRSQPEDWILAPTGTAGELTLSGSKRHVTGAAHADLLVVGLAGARLAVVETAIASVTTTPHDTVDRTRPAGLVEFHQAPAELLPGPSGIVGRVRDAALVLLAADAFGGAERCSTMTLDYAKQREQFGATIVQFQAIKHRLVDMVVSLEPSRALYWYAAHAQDRIPEESARAAALAKAHVTEVYAQIARDAVEVHGGIGYTWEYPLQVFFKRAMFDRAALGAPALHLARAARFG